MESIKDFLRPIAENKYLILTWVAVLTVVVIYILWKSEGFKWKSFQDAPIAKQKTGAAYGPVSRYSVEFSSTNQGGSNIFRDSANSMNQEGFLVGSSVGPEFNEIPKTLDDYRFANPMSQEEGFSNKSMFEDFKANPEQKLANILHRG